MMHVRTRFPLLSFAAAALLAGCGEYDGAAPGETHWHGPPPEDIDSVSMPVTCAPHLEFYPVGGPHNGGYDSNALNFTCGGSHPSSSPDNSDFIGGDHYGNDLFANEGTPAIAVVSGVVTARGYSGISGNRVTIMDSCGWHYFSAHLETIAPGISVGSNVTAGQLIGTVGDTGNAAGTQAHIHFSIYPESYNAGIDPFPLLQGVDTSSCTGEASLGEGQTPTPGVNPCTDADIGSNDNESSFAFLFGGGAVQSETGGLSGFQAQLPLGAGGTYTVGRWGPWISHTGLWEVDAFIPNTSDTLNRDVAYEVVFQGGRTVAQVDQEASKGTWVSLTPQPLKFQQGPRSYVGLSNASLDPGTVVWDAVRYRYIGPQGGAGVGSSCSFSGDCSGNLVCGAGGTCESDCTMVGCATGTCDIASGMCTEPSGDESDPLGQPAADFDGDGIPNYLEGDDDPDGDGFPSWLDYDSDGDGILDAVEGSGDSDGDGILDSQDLDSDNDGIPDADEVGEYSDLPIDSDLDGIPDYQDADSDNDGIPDSVESGGVNPPLDSDGDGIPNHLDEDSDNDGIPDTEEAGWEPQSPSDEDGDGIPDYLDNDREGPGIDLIDVGDDPFAVKGCAVGGQDVPSAWLLLGFGLLGLAARRRD
jgi:murein DD-endopeptidase MepM/ murein hydrolase activator NlpD